MFENREALSRSGAHAVALEALEVGVRAAHPATVIESTVAVEGDELRVGDTLVDLTRFDRIDLIGGGKAAATVASALEDLLGDRLDGGVVVTDTPGETRDVDVVVGDHPIPSDRGARGARCVLDRAREADENTLVLVTLSGGGSALLPAPAEGIDLEALRAVTEALLRSGATIDEINAVRKHASAIKGGGLARAAAPSRVVGLLLSDVVGNDPAVIASGPITPDETTFEAAATIIDRYSIDAPAPIADRIEAGIEGTVAETPDPGDPIFDRVTVEVLADGITALRAAAELVESRGITPLILSSRIRGEAREAAKTHVAIGEEIQATDNPVSSPAVVLSGGETTVTVRGDGEGGPNQEFALSAALEFADSGTVLAAIDTDGRDGGSAAAGAIVDADTIQDSAAARDALDENDAGGYLAEVESLLVTGQTGTNVNDLRALVVD